MLGIYCRVSKVKGKGEDTSIPVQKKYGVQLAQKLGLKYEFFIDDGISGTKEDMEDRPEFARLYKAVADKRITAVYVQYQDRLERSSLIWQIFVAIVLKTDCKFYPGGVMLDLNNPQNKFISDVMSANNALYAKLTSLRVKDSIRVRAAEGKFRGITAFGYMNGKDKKLEINVSEAKVIKRIFSLSLNGIGTYLIANKLNEEKVPTRFNSLPGTHKRKDFYTNKIKIFEKKDVRWRGNVIYDMLVNPIYKGQKELNNKIYDVPAIIDEETWDKVNANLTKNKKNVGKKAKYKYLLNGLIICSCCRREFVGKKRLVSNDNAYKCKGKIYPKPICTNSRGININKLDSFIIKHLFLSKGLKKYLQGLPNNTDDFRGLQLRLSKEKQVLVRKDDELRHAYQRLLSPDFKDDDVIESHVTTLKTAIEKQKELVEKLENEVIAQEAGNRKKRTSELINSYVVGANFSDIKKLVHSLIEYIKIEHQKQEGKVGYFLIEIKYKGFEEKSTFLTNWQAKKWLWLSRYRLGASNSSDLENDREELIGMMEYFGIEITAKTIKEFKKKSGMSDEEINKMNPFSEEFAGLEMVEGMHETIEINDDDLVYFD